MLSVNKSYFLFFFAFLIALALRSQELEPRALANIPIKTNFIATGYVYSQGDILLDPSIPIEDLNAKLNTFFVAYIRSFNFLGNSSKISVILTGADTYFEGALEGEYGTRDITGIGDPMLVFSTNFKGSPAQKPGKFKPSNPNIVFGGNIKIRFPLGQYEPDKLINLGSNRFVIKPQLGMSRTKGNWIFESYISVWFFTENNDFFGGNVLNQKPLFGLKQHFIYTFKNKMWLTLDAGYAFGGRTILNNVERDTKISTLRFGSTLAYPFGKGHVLKLTYNTGVRLERGPDFNSMALTYNYRWYDKQR